jgi:GNAT superfamily N-acetyltransferase
LRELVEERILPRGREAQWGYFCLHYPDRAWETAIAEVLRGKGAKISSQIYFTLGHLKVDWRAGLPDGFLMRPVDAALLSSDELHNVERVRNWAVGNFGSVDRFVSHGFGFCLVHGDVIVSWCMADCVSGRRCEIGIHTDERYRRRGFATRTAGRAVAHCLEAGLTDIGWHCWRDNVASAATAEAVGFKRTLEHCAFVL